MKGFHRFMVREGLSWAESGVGLTLPKVPLRLPDVLSIDAVNRVLDQDMRADNRPETVPSWRSYTVAACG